MTNLIINQNKSFQRHHWAQALFNFRWSYKDVGYLRFQQWDITVSTEANEMFDRVYFIVNLN